MEFFCHTVYNQETMTAMAKALRKSLRKKRSRRSHVLGTVVIIAAVLLALRQEAFTFRSGFTLAAAIGIAAVLIWEDSINGWIARKRTLPGLHSSSVTFSEDGYHSETEMGTSDFYYETVQHVVLCGNYAVFLFSANHAQAYDLRTLTGGTVDAFAEFIAEKTGKKPETV